MRRLAGGEENALVLHHDDNDVCATAMHTRKALRRGRGRKRAFGFIGRRIGIDNRYRYRYFVFSIRMDRIRACTFLELNSNPRLGGKLSQIKFARSSWRETFLTWRFKLIEIIEGAGWQHGRQSASAMAIHN